MDLAEARSVLGISASDDWLSVRAAYRRLIGDAHPDRKGQAGIERTVRLNAAYRTLGVANREGRLNIQPTAATTTPSRPAHRPHHHRGGSIITPLADDVRILGTDTLVLSSPPAETFRRVLEAAHELGEVSYVDRSCAILEAVVTLVDGTPASLVLSLQWRAHDASCEVFATLEALDRAEHLDVGLVLEQLAVCVPPDRGA